MVVLKLRHVRGEGAASLVGTGTYFKAWDGLLRWIQHQQEGAKAVNIQQFGRLARPHSPGTVGYILGN